MQTNACRRYRSAMMTTRAESSRNPTLFRKRKVTSSATSSTTQCSVSGSSFTYPSCTSLAYGTDFSASSTRSLFSQRTASCLKVFLLMLRLTRVVGWSAQPDATGFGGDSSQSVKTKIINLISAVRTLLRSIASVCMIDVSTFDCGKCCGDRV
jgi:Yos1-like